ncbi:Citrate transporter [Methanocaldococcus sp. FS406-22]|uniref:SLC13 family permease n=1 Tax=Methanocaldococcus sp. (strain FS406-22) TaxID=644281 RepID=UPI0001BF39E6|nr:SLC13 family permease [Methanocaldococcus sp. FS406-22]ADC70395.1 Citrate transporter [Methanocaldococcus sp. FS406-22]
MRIDTFIFLMFICIGMLLLLFGIIKPIELLHIVEWKTIFSLFYLMVIVNVMKDTKFLDYISLKILKKSKRIFIALIFLTLFLSPLITNDVSLFVIIPLTLIINQYTNMPLEDLEKLIIFEGISANIGSALTPIGNPQNLFLYHFYNIGALEFIINMLPFEVFGILVILPFLEFKRYDAKVDIDIEFKKEWIIYTAIFILVLLCVFGFLEFFLYILPLILAVMIYKRAKVDYLFLLTFIFLFVDIEGLKRIGIINMFSIKCNEIMLMIYSSLLSQIISNVPATVLLSNIYNEWLPIAYGVNVGGNGTLIASFANLITLRLSDKKVGIIRFLLVGGVIYLMHLTALAVYLTIF